MLSYTYEDLVLGCQYPIVGINKNSKKWELIGTCVLINVCGRYFLVTAAHVANERHNVRDKLLWLWNHADGVKTTINEDIVCIPYKDVKHHADVAIIEIRISEYPNLNQKQAINLEYVAKSLDVIEDSLGFIVTGYPSSKNKHAGDVTKKPKMSVITTKGGESKDYPTTIELDYYNEMLAEKGMALPKPQGMSGGGVWKITDKDRSLKLVALSVACIAREKKVVAVKISLVLSLIKFYFPGTVLDSMDLPIKVKDDDLFIKVFVPV